MKNNAYEIRMFSEFTITHNKETVHVTKYLGKQLLSLFQVLLYYRHQPLHKEKLIEVLWAESENPISLMKFTIFRLRKDIQRISFFKDKVLIITTKDGYQLNPAFEWKIDFEEVSEIWDNIKFMDDLDIEGLIKAYRLIELYKGRFFIANSNLLWAGQTSEFYRQVYVKSIIKICKKLTEEQAFDKMMSLNYSAILLEPFSEELHYYYLKGLLETSDRHKASKYYDDLNESFLRELGAGLSDRFKELYNVIMKDHEDINRLELDHLIKELSFRTEKVGGFYCTFEMFKYIYELSVKTGKRENKQYYIISFEIVNEEDNNEEINLITNRVRQLIARLLRNSDVFAKINRDQFIVLVNCRSLDNAYLIIQRISKKFYSKFRSNEFRLHYKVAEAVLLEKDDYNM